jgi:MraZ protein
VGRWPNKRVAVWGIVGYYPTTDYEWDTHVVVLTGTFQHTIDKKHRIAIPADVRNRLRWEAATPDTPIFFMVTLGEGGTLCIYEESEFEKRAEQLEDSELDTAELLAFEQLMFSLANRCEMDKQGRIRLPDNLLTLAKLGTEVTVIGVKDHLEVKDRQAWNAYVVETLATNPGILMNPRRAMRKRMPQSDAEG